MRESFDGLMILLTIQWLRQAKKLHVVFGVDFHIILEGLHDYVVQMSVFSIVHVMA